MSDDSGVIRAGETRVATQVLNQLLKRDMPYDSHLKVLDVLTLLERFGFRHIEHCAICRNKLQELCIDCQANQQEGTIKECTLSRGAGGAGACEHEYHFHCITRWLKQRSVCPLDNKTWEFQTAALGDSAVQSDITGDNARAAIKSLNKLLQKDMPYESHTKVVDVVKLLEHYEAAAGASADATPASSSQQERKRSAQGKAVGEREVKRAHVGSLGAPANATPASPSSQQERRRSAGGKTEGEMKDAEEEEATRKLIHEWDEHPGEWVEAESGGQVYYYHHITRDTVWDLPEGAVLKPGKRPNEREVAPVHEGEEQALTVKVASQDGQEMYFKIRRGTRLSLVMDEYCNRRGVITTRNARSFRVSFLYDGTRVQRDDTPDSLDMEDQDVIDVLVENLGSIGVYGIHDGVPGTAFLRGEENATQALAKAILGQFAQSVAQRAIGAHAISDLPKPFTFLSDRCFVAPDVRRRLMDRLDALHASSPRQDVKLKITAAELEALVGIESMSMMKEAFAAPIDCIKLRRVESRNASDARQVIKFHLDVPSKTMGIPLNDESEYCGSRLVFATPEGMVYARRNAGCATVHDNTVPHGVTPLTSGVRYGLFLLAN